jgi:hypothetical protein
MNRMTRNVLYGYGAFCAVNWGLTYMAARSGSPLLFGSAGLLNLNESLRKVNVLAYLIDPLQVAQKQGAAAPAGPTGQTFLPTQEAVTQYQSGTTTTFGP